MVTRPLARALDGGDLGAARALLERLSALLPGRLHVELQRHGLAVDVLGEFDGHGGSMRGMPSKKAPKGLFASGVRPGQLFLAGAAAGAAGAAGAAAAAGAAGAAGV